ncbi:MAG: hypothetical protein U1B78_01400, partial [Dehalococcoidia bacterium]|nr:hypothetical protein [Dehalococcoidia bacterium]
MAQEPPRQIGPYAVVDRLGVGGMGVVYRARDTRTGQIVAVKVMRTELAQNFSFVRRFQREARIAQDLDSPNIVRVLDAGGDGDT